MAPDRFSAEEDEKLIDLIACNEILWNMGHSEWKNLSKKDIVWTNLGNMLNKTSGQCKMRWKSIRDYHKKQRRHETNMPVGSVTGKKRATYWDRLKFLDTADDDRSNSSNVNTRNDTETSGEEIDDYETSREPQCSSPRSNPLNKFSDKVDKPPTKKPKTVKNKSVFKELLSAIRNDSDHFQRYVDILVQRDCEDENELFFKSIAKTVEKFSPDLISEAKKKIFAIVMELEDIHQARTAYY